MKVTGLMRPLKGVLLLALMAGLMSAQTAGTGALTGTVTDSTGAVVPNASVTATNADTGQTRTGNTDAQGSYRFALLPPGSYNIKFTASGFKTIEVPRVAFAVTKTPVLDEKLELGTQTEQVTVEASAETIQTTSATLGTTLGATSMTAIPQFSAPSADLASPGTFGRITSTTVQPRLIQLAPKYIF